MRLATSSTTLSSRQLLPLQPHHLMLASHPKQTAEDTRAHSSDRSSKLSIHQEHICRSSNHSSQMTDRLALLVLVTLAATALVPPNSINGHPGPCTLDGGDSICILFVRPFSGDQPVEKTCDGHFCGLSLVAETTLPPSRVFEQEM